MNDHDPGSLMCIRGGLPKIAGISKKGAKPNLERRLLNGADILGHQEELLPGGGCGRAG